MSRFITWSDKYILPSLALSFRNKQKRNNEISVHTPSNQAKNVSNDVNKIPSNNELAGRSALKVMAITVAGVNVALASPLIATTDKVAVFHLSIAHEQIIIMRATPREFREL